MIVVDASAIVGLLTYTGDRGRKARAVLGRDPEWAAPEYWKIEVLSGVRGLLLGGKIADELADRTLGRIARLGVDTVPIDRLMSRIWQMRANVSAYDAGYVALAERRSLALVTGDARLARAATAYCRVELVS